MSKVRYLAARILQMDYKNMLRVAGVVAKKSGKSLFWVMRDMIHCGLTYQAGYYDYQEFEFYLLTPEQRATYLTRGINNAIVKKYNDKAWFDRFNDKALFNEMFVDYLHRGWCDLRRMSGDEFAAFAQLHPVVIAKPVDGEGGQGVERYQLTQDPRAAYAAMCAKGQMMVEDLLAQHPALAALYPDSVNTLRIFTFYRDGQAHFLQAILKIGNCGIADNFSAGGMYTFLDENGTVIVPAIDRADRLYERHPRTGMRILGFQVPFFAEARAMGEQAAALVPQIGYVGWDIAITPKGPAMIEGNCFPGVFQIRASLNPEKTGVLPRYRAAGMEI